KHGGWDDSASLKMMHAGAQHVIDTGEEAGIDTELTKTVQDYYRRAIEASETAGKTVPVFQIIRDHPAYEAAYHDKRHHHRPRSRRHAIGHRRAPPSDQLPHRRLQPHR